VIGAPAGGPPSPRSRDRLRRGDAPRRTIGERLVVGDGVPAEQANQLVRAVFVPHGGRTVIVFLAGLACVAALAWLMVVAARQPVAGVGLVAAVAVVVEVPRTPVLASLVRLDSISI
jgi:hypothetical protein